MEKNNSSVFTALECAIFQDPGNRGLCEFWPRGCLERAATHILSCARKQKSYVLTGFCCMFGRCETDGPLGTSVLCSTLRALGFDTHILCDSHSAAVVRAAARKNPVIVADDPRDVAEPSFVVSVERPGRSRKTGDFRTMKARDITSVTAPLDELFPRAGERMGYLTVAVGDGGNEVGTGNVCESVAKYVDCGEAICTSVGCDDLVMAGVSNWGALGIAAALVFAANDAKAKDVFVRECAAQREILQDMLDAGSFDGCTGKAELSIDGMAFEREHLAVTNRIVEIVNKAFS